MAKMLTTIVLDALAETPNRRRMSPKFQKGPSEQSAVTGGRLVG
jgi:hypothetical protein